MKRTSGWMVGFAVAGLLLGGCRQEMSHKVVDDTAVAIADYKIGEPVTHGNLTIFPVSSKTPRIEDRFITLDEGLKAGTIEVFEIGSEDGEGVPQPSDAYPNASPNFPDVDFDNDLNDVAPQPPAVEPSGCEETLNEEEEGAEQVADEPIEEQPDVQIDEPQIDEPQNQIEELQPQLVDDIEFQQGNYDGGGREVNRLMVINKSDRPLYLMPGEIIIGGSQDRTIGSELVIAPTGKPVPIDVFCVEAHRWSDREVEQTVAELNAASTGALGGSIAVEGQADVDVAVQEIAKGKFIASVGNLNKSARLALNKSGEQGKVWEAVAVQNSASKVAADDATFSANYSNAEFNQQLEPFVEELQQPIADHENIVGVIVAVNGKVESMDMFESTPLFKKLWPKLLKSYALDAATHAVDAEDGNAKEVVHAPLTIADAQTFFGKAIRGEVTKEDSTGELAVTSREHDDVICFSSRRMDVTPVGDQVLPLASEAAPMDAEVSGGFGGGVHTSAFAH